MRRKIVQNSLISMLAVGGLVALSQVPRTSSAADDSYGRSAADTMWSAGESTKDAAKNAGSAVKDSAESAAGTVTDSAKNAGARLAGKDTLFVRKAAIGGLSEVKSAEIAKEKASSPEVKSFAAQMIQDHTKANGELERLVKQKGFTVPTALDNEHQSKLDKLSNLSGKAFDQAYVKQQKMGHETMLRLLQDEAKNGKDPDLKSFAAKTEKVVAEHHARIGKMGKGTTSSAG